MRIRNRKLGKIFKVYLILSITLSFSYFGYYGLKVTQLNKRVLEFQTRYPPNPAEFQNANFTLMDQMARVYDDLFQENHIPLNFTARVTYKNDTSGDIEKLDFTDNGGLWTGIAMASWVFHYLAAGQENNLTDQNYALEVVRRLVSGMAMLVQVPNGGLGPEFPGELARGWSPPGYQTIEPWFFQEDEWHFNGTGIYSQYRWRGFASLDEFGGYYMGLALALKYIPDPDIQFITSQIILQIANFMIASNFEGINYPGGPTGVDIKARFGAGGFWVPLLLKMASIVDPETYESHYYHWVSAEWNFLANHEGSAREVLANYYSYNFANCMMFAFLLLEGTESRIGQHFYEGYLESMWSFVQNHRNAWFNAIFLVLAAASPGDYPIIEKDIEDQLMRLRINHFPDRAFPTTPVPENHPRLTELEDLKLFLDNHNWAGLFAVPFIDVGLNDVFYAKPLTVEYQRNDMFMWQRCPYENRTGEWINPYSETSGLTFTVPYWVGRYLGFIQPEGVRIS